MLSPNGSTRRLLWPRGSPILDWQQGEGRQSNLATDSPNSALEKPSGPGKANIQPWLILSSCGFTQTGLAVWSVWSGWVSRAFFRTSVLVSSNQVVIILLVLPSTLPSPAPSTPTARGPLRSLS